MCRAMTVRYARKRTLRNARIPCEDDDDDDGSRRRREEEDGSRDDEGADEWRLLMRGESLTRTAGGAPEWSGAAAAP